MQEDYLSTFSLSSPVKQKDLELSNSLPILGSSCNPPTTLPFSNSSLPPPDLFSLDSLYANIKPLNLINGINLGDINEKENKGGRKEKEKIFFQSPTFVCLTCGSYPSPFYKLDEQGNLICPVCLSISNNYINKIIQSLPKGNTPQASPALLNYFPEFNHLSYSYVEDTDEICSPILPTFDKVTRVVSREKDEDHGEEEESEGKLFVDFLSLSSLYFIAIDSSCFSRDINIRNKKEYLNSSSSSSSSNFFPIESSFILFDTVFELYLNMLIEKLSENTQVCFIFFDSCLKVLEFNSGSSLFPIKLKVLPGWKNNFFTSSSSSTNDSSTSTPTISLKTASNAYSHIDLMNCLIPISYLKENKNSIINAVNNLFCSKNLLKKIIKNKDKIFNNSSLTSSTSIISTDSIDEEAKKRSFSSISSNYSLTLPSILNFIQYFHYFLSGDKGYIDDRNEGKTSMREGEQKFNENISLTCPISQQKLFILTHKNLFLRGIDGKITDTLDSYKKLSVNSFLNGISINIFYSNDEVEANSDNILALSYFSNGKFFIHQSLRDDYMRKNFSKILEEKNYYQGLGSIQFRHSPGISISNLNGPVLYKDELENLLIKTPSSTETSFSPSTASNPFDPFPLNSPLRLEEISTFSSTNTSTFFSLTSPDHSHYQRVQDFNSNSLHDSPSPTISSPTFSSSYIKNKCFFYSNFSNHTEINFQISKKHEEKNILFFLQKLLSPTTSASSSSFFYREGYAAQVACNTKLSSFSSPTDPPVSTFSADAPWNHQSFSEIFNEFSQDSIFGFQVDQSENTSSLLPLYSSIQFFQVITQFFAYRLTKNRTLKPVKVTRIFNLPIFLSDHYCQFFPLVSSPSQKNDSSLNLFIFSYNFIKNFIKIYHESLLKNFKKIEFFDNFTLINNRKDFILYLNYIGNYFFSQYLKDKISIELRKNRENKDQEGLKLIMNYIYLLKIFFNLIENELLDGPSTTRQLSFCARHHYMTSPYFSGLNMIVPLNYIDISSFPEAINYLNEKSSSSFLYEMKLPASLPHFTVPYPYWLTDNEVSFIWRNTTSVFDFGKLIVVRNGAEYEEEIEAEKALENSLHLAENIINNRYPIPELIILKYPHTPADRSIYSRSLPNHLDNIENLHAYTPPFITKDHLLAIQKQAPLTDQQFFLQYLFNNLPQLYLVYQNIFSFEYSSDSKETVNPPKPPSLPIKVLQTYLNQDDQV